ncbi:hypothetical protein [Paucibacter sp. XJ19-41]|uniref:hypothetical protein n=1 Tax=Paucibacter sp. XJ19-41 TaxID=2927824 RepID=UPI00234B1F42|nr:hypothetical protein [Paucibacter sp. XJ19-41]MDC6170815.1 hypothetical protein [Paucibacter sp. XJ19-41]
MSVVATLGCFAFGAWRFVIAHSTSGLAVGSFALGSALLALTVATCVTYAFAPFAILRQFGGSLLVSAIAYVGVFAYAVLKRRLEFGNLLLFAVVGFVGLCFFGFYAALLVACSFGDCL